jgi:hypothetical protein
LYGRGRGGIVVVVLPAATGNVSVGCAVLLAQRPTVKVTPDGRSSGSPGVLSGLGIRWVSRRDMSARISALVCSGAPEIFVSNHAVDVLALTAPAASSVQTT